MRRLWIILILPVLLYPGIGDTVASFELDIEQPIGMTRSGNRLLISDRATGRLFTFSIKDSEIVKSTLLPCAHPWGICRDDAGLWISDRENRRLLHLDLKENRVDRVLSEVETDATGLAWDGACLWATSGNHFLKLDASDGTELQTFQGPGRDTTSIFFDGAYLWMTERYGDKIVCATPEGVIFAVLPSPGPYPSGICRVDNRLWILDFQDRVLYVLDISPRPKPFYLGEKHRRKVRFTHRLVNHGPSSDVTARLYMCVGEEDDHQKLLTPISFFPESLTFVTDKWGQKFGLLRGTVPAMKFIEQGYHLEVETRDLHHFILPDWVDPLEKIPQNIRKKYLVDGHKLKLGDPFLEKLAEKVVGDEKNPFWIAFKIHRYLHKNMAYKMTGGWNAAPTILKRGNGSCSEFTFAYMALARTAGLPARYEAGLVVRGDDGSMDRVYHRWAQVYLPPYGWVPVDPSRGMPATAMDVANSFGSLSHRFFITTHSGGDSSIMGWTYNYNSFYGFTGQAVVDIKAEAKWFPVNQKRESVQQ